MARPGAGAFVGIAAQQQGQHLALPFANMVPQLNHALTHITPAIALQQPDATYASGLTWSGTGLQFNSDPAVVRDAIALLKKRQPNTRVLVAVGGATYTNWGSLNPTAIANFVTTFGLDGVDIGEGRRGGSQCLAVPADLHCPHDWPASGSCMPTPAAHVALALPQTTSPRVPLVWSAPRVWHAPVTPSTQAPSRHCAPRCHAPTSCPPPPGPLALTAPGPLSTRSLGPMVSTRRV